MEKKSDMNYSGQIPTEFVIGRNYHCNWALDHNGQLASHWALVSFNEMENSATLKTRRNKYMTTQLTALRDTQQKKLSTAMFTENAFKINRSEGR